MLSEYRDFLVNVRNNLIQSGVEYPIRPMDTYEELFYEAVNLQQVLWYFSVMAIGDDSQELGITETRCVKGFTKSFVLLSTIIRY